MRSAPGALFARVADTYDGGNPLLVIERPETEALLPELRGRDVLDLGAGHAHYARLAVRRGARRVLALDLHAAMLRGQTVAASVGDAAALPFRDAAFDVLIAALVVSYLDRRRAFAEAARVLRPRGTLILSELHAQGAAAGGWQRTFPEPGGKIVAIPAPPPSRETLARELEDAGFQIETIHESMVDDRLEPYFRRAGRRDYRTLAGTPLLLHIVARGNHASA